MHIASFPIRSTVPVGPGFTPPLRVPVRLSKMGRNAAGRVSNLDGAAPESTGA